MKKITFVCLLSLIYAGCAHHRDVRPGTDGVHRVSVQTDNKEEGARDAISQANHYCDQYKKSAAFMEENQKYTGDMDEKSYKKAKTVAKVAQGVGGAAWVFGGKNESNAGGIVGLGSGIADGVLGKGYTVEMKFKCQ